MDVGLSTVVLTCAVRIQPIVGVVDSLLDVLAALFAKVYSVVCKYLVNTYSY